MRRLARRSSSSESPSRVWLDHGSFWQERSTLITDRHPHRELAGEDQEYLVVRELDALRRCREPGPREAQAAHLREIHLQPPGERLRGAHRTTHHALQQVQIELIKLQGDGLGRHAADLVPLNRDTSLREASSVHHRRRAASGLDLRRAYESALVLDGSCVHRFQHRRQEGVGGEHDENNQQEKNSAFLDTALGDGSVLQVGVDKGVDVAIKDAVHVRRLLDGAVVLHQLVRVEDVGADLGPPLYVRLLPTYRGDLLLTPLSLELEEARPKDAHRDLAVLVLAALVLALNHYPGRQVRYAHRRVGFVDVLPSRPRCPVGIHLEVLLVDLDLHPVVYDGGDGNRGEARVPAGSGVERADPYQTVHPALGRKKPEGVLARDREGGALYAGLLALGVLDDLKPEAPALGPAPVHPGQHLGPVLRVHPARARVYREDRTPLVVLAGKKPRDLLLLEHPLDPPELLLDLGDEIAVLGRKLE